MGRSLRGPLKVAQQVSLHAEPVLTAQMRYLQQHSLAAALCFIQCRGSQHFQQAQDLDITNHLSIAKYNRHLFRWTVKLLAPEVSIFRATLATGADVFHNNPSPIDTRT